MNNLILFVNSFFSYLLVMVVIVAVAGLGLFAGISLRRRADEKAAEADRDGEAPVAQA